MTSARERSGEPDPQDVFGQTRSQQPATKCKYIGIIMFPAISSGSSIIAQGRPDTREFVGDDGRADARSVDNHAARRLASCDNFGHVTGDVGVIRRLLLMNADVVDMEVQLVENWLQFFFERKSAMIGTERDGLSGCRAGGKLIGGDFHQLDAAIFGEIARRGCDDRTPSDLELAGLWDIGLGDDFSH